MPLLNYFIWLILTPSNFLLLLLVVGCVWLAISRHRRGVWPLLVGVFTLVLIGVFPIAEILIIPLENRFPRPVLPNQVDGIVVLGGSVSPRVSQARDYPTVKGSADRLFAAAALARQYPEARVILSGGIVVPYPNAIAESQVMREVLEATGIAGSRLELESRSRNTCENAQYSYQLAQPKPGQTWIMVTSANHMPRAVACFRTVGFTVLPYPVDYRTTGEVIFTSKVDLVRNLSLLDLAFHEWVGLIGYRMLGRTDELFPQP